MKKLLSATRDGSGKIISAALTPYGHEVVDQMTALFIEGMPVDDIAATFGMKAEHVQFLTTMQAEERLK